MENNSRCVPVGLGDKVKWINLESFTTLPFLDKSTIASLDAHTFESDFDALSRSDKKPLTKPAGFIFHTSRCGSTLIAKVLQKNIATLVLNEPQPINALLVAFTGENGQVSREQWEETGDSMIQNLIYSYLNTGLRIFIKFSSFNLLLIDRILNRWRDVPVLLVYRNPIEVVVSHLEGIGGFIRRRKDPRFQNILRQSGAEIPDHLTTEEYCIRIIGIFFQTMIDHLKRSDRSNIMLMDYERIDHDGLQQVMSFFKIAITPDVMQKISECISYDAKTGKPFTDDRAEKHAKANKVLHDLCDEFILPKYQILKEYEDTYSGNCGCKHKLA